MVVWSLVGSEMCVRVGWWCVVFVGVSAAGVCMSVAVTAILADEINDQLSLQMVSLFVGVCVCLLSSVCVCVCGGALCL